jgi:hypothetical protein
LRIHSKLEVKSKTLKGTEIKVSQEKKKSTSQEVQENQKEEQEVTVLDFMSASLLGSQEGILFSFSFIFISVILGISSSQVKSSSFLSWNVCVSSLSHFQFDSSRAKTKHFYPDRDHSTRKWTLKHSLAVLRVFSLTSIGIDI